MCHTIMMYPMIIDYRNSGENKLSPVQILQNCVTPLEILRSKTKTHGNSTSNCSILNTPGNSTSFLVGCMYVQRPHFVSSIQNPGW